MFRIATHDDTEQIQKLVADIFADYGVGLELEGVDAYLKDPGEYCRQRGGEYWVVESDGGIVATVGLILLDEATAELKSLYVSRSARRQGLGRRLVERVVDFARTAGRQRLVLWSDTRFADAHRLYLRLGFVQQGQRALDDAYDSREYRFERALVPKRRTLRD